MEHDQIENQGDLTEYIIENEERIAVREEIDGQWGSYFLTELPKEKRAKHMGRMVREGLIPVVMKDENN